MIARSIGAAPRQRGSSDGWTLINGSSLRSGSRISCPKAQTTTASGRAAADPLELGLGVDVSGLGQLDPDLLRGLGGGGRQLLPAAAATAVGRGDDERRAMPAPGQTPEYRGRELGGTEEGGPHASVRGSRWEGSESSTSSSSSPEGL